MGAGVKRSRENSPSPAILPKARRKENSDSDSLTEDEEVNKRLAARQLQKEQTVECFNSGLKDFGITKTMERAAG